MKTYTSESIRNIALIGHSGEGKTSLAEAMLFTAKSIDRLGKVDDGTSAMDYDPEEINRKISISMALAYAEWKGIKVNIIDVPGFFDFEGEQVAALHVADAALIVTSASGQLTVGTEKAIENCTEKGVPAMVVINQMNKENSDYKGTLEAIKSAFGSKIVPVQIPIIEGGKMVGVVDVLAQKAIMFDKPEAAVDVPADYAAELAAVAAELNEVIASSSDELMEKFFMEEPFTAEELRSGMLTALANDSFVPVVYANATTATGASLILDKIVSLLPSPVDGKKHTATVDGEIAEVGCDASKPFSAQIFKSLTDQFVGKMLLFKVQTGKLSSGDTINNVNAGKPEKVGSIYIIKGKKQETVSEINTGDIGALAKLMYTGTNDTLADASFKIQYDAIEFPQPVISFAVGADDEKDSEKVIGGLTKMQDEDATFKVERNNETNEMLISGLGEAQLDIMCKRVKNKFGVVAKLSEPRIAYRETIRGTAEAEGKHKKQSGGAGQFGQVMIRFEPGAEDGEFEFVDAVVGGAVPKQFIPAVEKGLREAIKKGVLAEYPMVNLKATLFDGKYHPVDSKEIAFVTAAKLSYADGCLKARPCFLEPIMELKITVPENYLGDIMGDMNKRRGRILGTEHSSGKQIITVEVPQGELFRYATDLRSMTQGRGKFSIKFLRYEEVPESSKAKIIEDAKKRKEAEKK